MLIHHMMQQGRVVDYFAERIGFSMRDVFMVCGDAPARLAQPLTQALLHPDHEQRGARYLDPAVKAYISHGPDTL